VSLTVGIELASLDDAEAARLNRMAELVGLPLRFVRRAGLRRREVPPHVALEDLESDPSIASETLDNPAEWPQSHDVRKWLGRMMSFLVEHAPDFFLNGLSARIVQGLPAPGVRCLG
jgi:hypothetical protein